MSDQASVMEPYIRAAKQLLREKLRDHPDFGVRAMMEIVELDDGHPAVQAVVAEMLRYGIPPASEDLSQ